VHRPNGAGKTTMMDVITGKTRPTRSTVRFRDATSRGWTRPHRHLGIGRKFQKPTVFDALDRRSRTWTRRLQGAARPARLPALGALRRGRRRVEASLLTRRPRLPRADHAAILSHGQRQWLESGMLLMQDPELLLVDEPVGGMTDQETEHTAALLRRIAGERSVVVVEHDLEFVRALGRRVTVLHEGSVLSEGSIDHVQNDPRVVEVYLGR
jgi:urea transport system ATP-binding protein